MRIFAQEEYGLRCLLRLAAADGDSPVPVQVIADAEGLSGVYTAKLLRLLREGDLVTSTRGASGGYRLARPPAEITIWEAVLVLGGALFDAQFCSDHNGQASDCVRSTECSIRSLWSWIGLTLQRAMESVRLSDLMQSEQPMSEFLHLVQLGVPPFAGVRPTELVHLSKSNEEGIS